jgi:hypothetical protein
MRRLMQPDQPQQSTSVPREVEMSPDLHSAAAPANTQIKLMIVAISASNPRLTSRETSAPSETATLTETVI